MVLKIYMPFKLTTLHNYTSFLIKATGCATLATGWVRWYQVVIWLCLIDRERDRESWNLLLNIPFSCFGFYFALFPVLLKKQVSYWDIISFDFGAIIILVTYLNFVKRLIFAVIQFDWIYIKFPTFISACIYI